MARVSIGKETPATDPRVAENFANNDLQNAYINNVYQGGKWLWPNGVAIVCDEDINPVNDGDPNYVYANAHKYAMHTHYFNYISIAQQIDVVVDIPARDVVYDTYSTGGDSKKGGGTTTTYAVLQSGLNEYTLDLFGQTSTPAFMCFENVSNRVITGSYALNYGKAFRFLNISVDQYAARLREYYLMSEDPLPAITGAQLSLFLLDQTVDGSQYLPHPNEIANMNAINGTLRLGEGFFDASKKYLHKVNTGGYLMPREQNIELTISNDVTNFFNLLRVFEGEDNATFITQNFPHAQGLAASASYLGNLKTGENILNNAGAMERRQPQNVLSGVSADMIRLQVGE
jgi:hypothetical protein